MSGERNPYRERNHKMSPIAESPRTTESPHATTGFPARFFAAAFGFTWAFWVLAALADNGLITLPVPSDLLLQVGGFGPMVAALALTATANGRAGLRSLLGRALRWRVAPIWYAVVLVGPFLFQLTGMVIHAALGGQPPDLAALAGMVPSVLVQSVFVLLLVATAEEFGWRGYALPRLQARHNALLASVILGVVWAVWHLPLFFNPDTSYSNTPFWVWMVFLLPYAVVQTWVYNGTGGSLLMCMMLHAVVNSSGNLWMAIPAYGAADVLTTAVQVHVYLMQAAVLFIAAAAIVAVYGPRNLSRRPRQVAEPTTSGGKITSKA
jgi:membrane protease YdiL (CAAX protease family)